MHKRPITFGQAVRACRLERGYSVHDLAERAGVRSRAVEAWERDEERPEGRERPRLFGALRHLKRYRQLIDEPTIHTAGEGEMQTNTRNGTNGSNGHGSAHERLAWAQRKWREDPDIPIAGVDGMLDLLTREFGASASVDALKTARAELRHELARERLRAPLSATLAERTRAAAEPAPAPTAPPTAPTTAPEPSMPNPPATGAEPSGRSQTSASDAAVRAAYARQIARPGMNMRDLRAEVKKRFGVSCADPVLSAALAGAGRVMKPGRPLGRVSSRDPNLDTAGHTGYEFTPEGTAIRAAYARSIVRPKMTRRDLVARVKRKFRVGLNGNTAAAILSEARGGQRRRDYRGPTTKPATPATPARSAPTPPARDPHRYYEQQIRAAVELLISEVPGLRELHVSRPDGGKPRVTFTVETVSTGSLSL